MFMFILPCFVCWDAKRLCRMKWTSWKQREDRRKREETREMKKKEQREARKKEKSRRQRRRQEEKREKREDKNKRNWKWGRSLNPSKRRSIINSNLRTASFCRTGGEVDHKLEPWSKREVDHELKPRKRALNNMLLSAGRSHFERGGS